MTYQLDLFGWMRRGQRRGLDAVPPAHVRSFRLPEPLQRWPLNERREVFRQQQLTLELGLR